VNLVIEKLEVCKVAKPDRNPPVRGTFQVLSCPGSGRKAGQSNAAWWLRSGRGSPCVFRSLVPTASVPAAVPPCRPCDRPWVGRVTSTSGAKAKLPNLRRLDVRRNEVDEKLAATDPRICVDADRRSRTSSLTRGEGRSVPRINYRRAIWTKTDGSARRLSSGRSRRGRADAELHVPRTRCPSWDVASPYRAPRHTTKRNYMRHGLARCPSWNVTIADR